VDLVRYTEPTSLLAGDDSFFWLCKVVQWSVDFELCVCVRNLRSLEGKVVQCNEEVEEGDNTKFYVLCD
jgi:hypothetical protein